MTQKFEHIYRLSPSDFAFLYHDCKRCFYRKVKYGLYPPRAPLANIFTKIDYEMKKALLQDSLNTFHPSLPELKALPDWDDEFLTSEYLVHPKINHIAFYIFGKLDNVSRIADTESYAVIDYKTTIPNKKHMMKYCRQLHAYKYALEHPGINPFTNKPSPQLGPIDILGLLCYNPKQFKINSKHKYTGVLGGDLSWFPLSVNEEDFLEFVAEIAELIAGDLPESGEDCIYCKFLKQIEENKKELID